MTQALTTAYTPPPPELPPTPPGQTFLGKVMHIHRTIATFAEDTSLGAEKRIGDLFRAILSCIPLALCSEESKETIAAGLGTAANAATWIALQLIHLMPYLAIVSFITGAVILTYTSPLLAIALFSSTAMIILVIFTIKIAYRIDTINQNIASLQKEAVKFHQNTLQQAGQLNQSIDGMGTNLIETVNGLGRNVVQTIDIPTRTRNWLCQRRQRPETPQT